MPFQRRALPLALLILSSAAPCHAQTWDADSVVQQFAWGPVNVLVIADTVTGLGLWAATSSMEYQGERHEFGASFNPDSMDRWLNQAHAVSVQGGNADSGTATVLRTAPLFAIDSSAIVFLRKRDTSHWSDQMELVFLDKDRKSLWSVDASTSEANDILTSMFVQAARSRLIPRHPSAVPPPANSPDGDVAPRLVKTGRVLPPRRIAAISAHVTLQFVIGMDGKAERGSIRTVSYSDPRFVDAAIAAIMDCRYAPGKLSGVPVRVTVRQTLDFKGRPQAQYMENFPRPRRQPGDIWSSSPF